MGTSTLSAGRFRTGTILVYFLSLLLIGSAAVKLVGIPIITSQMAALGFYGGKLIFIAVLESVSAILFAFPRTRSFGLLLVSAYLGGAMATHVSHDQALFRPAIVLAMCWLAVWLRHPEMLWSFNRTSSQAQLGDSRIAALRMTDTSGGAV